MKQVLMFVLAGASCFVAAFAVSVGEPAHAEIAVAQAASEPLVDKLALSLPDWTE